MKRAFAGSLNYGLFMQQNHKSLLTILNINFLILTINNRIFT